MKTYRIRFVQQGPMTELPRSQAVFGAFCHGIKAIFGKDDLESFLSAVEHHDELFAVSSIFLSDTLPFPLDVEPVRMDTARLAAHDFASFKTIKKIKYLSTGLFKQYKENPDTFNVTFLENLFGKTYVFINEHRLLCFKDESSEFRKIQVKDDVATRNKWSLDDEGKALFFTSRTVYSKDTSFDVYVYGSEERVHKIHEMLEKISLMTFGGMQSIGMNLFKFTSIEPVLFDLGKSRVLLSRAIVNPKEVDLDLALYKVEQVASVFDNRVEESRYRKPMIVFEEGSVFQENISTIGHLVKDIVNDEAIYQNAIGLLI